MSPLVPVRVVYEVERTVYVEAATGREARELAADVDQWVDTDVDLIHERMETLRVVRKQRVEVPA